MQQYDFEEIYAKHKENVWNLISKYVFSQHDREDIFQEVFLNIHRALPKFRGESAIETWIYRITVNTAINYLKKKKRYDKLKEVLNGFRSIEKEEEEEPVESSVWKPLEKLNPRQRMILLLSDVEEKNLEEIGRILDIPVGTVKSNLHRAREIIRKELKENG